MRKNLQFGGTGFAVLLFSFLITSCSKQNGALDNTPALVEGEGDSCEFKTFTQGGWGSKPHGNNPGSYQFKNFDAAFPNGLAAGCGTYELILTSAQAVSDFLPSGGQAAVLTNSYIDPTDLKNVLAGQLVALTLSVGFDLWDPAFAASPLHLGNLTVISGPFQGMTVNAVLAEANNALGGCQSNFSISDLNSILSAINENFDNGNTNNNVLDCNGGEGGLPN